MVPCAMHSAPDFLATAKPLFKILLAVAMVVVGALHFVRPKPFIRIVPAALPNPRALVLVSGFFEIAGGVGLLLPPTQHVAAWGLIALYVAVFPANVNMAIHRISLHPKRPIPPLSIVVTATASIAVHRVGLVVRLTLRVTGFALYVFTHRRGVDIRISCVSRS